MTTLTQELAQVEATIEALLLRKKELEDAIEVEKKSMEAAKAVATKSKGASRVKRSKAVDTMVEAVKGKRDVNKGDADKIDAAKEAAMSVKPEKVQQEKRSTKKAEKAETKKVKSTPRSHDGMSYQQLRSNVATRKAKLNKADQERMNKAGCKNNTWEGAIACYEWLNKYFATVTA